MAGFQTGNVQPNEIVKATDIQFAFESIVDNTAKIAKMILDSTQDFIIGGKVTPYGDSMNINIAPIFGLCYSTGEMFGDTESNTNKAVTPSSTSDRIDIVEVQGDWEEYDEQQRAFNDFDTDTQTYQTVATKNRRILVVTVKTGTPGSVQAPATDDGFVKIAEIHVRANSDSIVSSDIYNITSDIAGVENSAWTNEKSKTYNIGFISDVNKRFRVQHNADGTHKAGIIGTDELDIGTGTKQVSGLTLPAAVESSIGSETTSATDSVATVLSKVAKQITDIFKNYLKYGVYGFNGEIQISNLLDSESALYKAFKIGTNTIDNQRYMYLSFNGKNILTIFENGTIRGTSEYTVSNDYDLVNKTVTDSITAALDALALRVTNIENTSDTTVYANNTLSRYSLSSDTIQFATTTNVSLSGAIIIDSKSPSDGDLILVKNQTDKKNNGIYIYSSSGVWTRPTAYSTTGSLKEKLFAINNGSANKGKIFYTPKVNFSTSAFGNDDITFSEYFGSIEPVKNKIAYRDESGHVKSAAATSDNDCLIKADLLNLIYPIGSLYWSSKDTDPSALFGGTWTQIKDKFVLAAGDTYTSGKTDGAATISLTVENLPSHSHTCSTTNTDHTHNAKHSHSFSGITHEWAFYESGGYWTNAITTNVTAISKDNLSTSAYGLDWASGRNGYKGISWTDSGTVNEEDFETGTCNSAQSHSHNISGTFDNEAFSIMPPYIVKYCWERTA